jgi:hypothetical protein
MAATWSFDHPAIDHGLPLCLAIPNDLSLAIGSTKNKSESNLTATRVSIQLLQPNAQSRIRNKIKIYKQNSRVVVRCTDAFLDPKAMLVSSQLNACGRPNTHHNLMLVIWRICKRWPQLHSAMHGVQIAI